MGVLAALTTVTLATLEGKARLGLLHTSSKAMEDLLRDCLLEGGNLTSPRDLPCHNGHSLGGLRVHCRSRLLHLLVQIRLLGHLHFYFNFDFDV